ncbi:MAG: tetratricopeptide repeat protein, partial [Desulfocapsaceae bacterium]
RNVYNQVKNKINIGFLEMGPQKVKNIEEPIVTYKIILDSETKGLQTTNSEQNLTLPDKPSVAVLPFDNLSGDPEQEYFSDGMTDDIITDLSKIPELFVIARNSSFIFKGQIVDATEIGRRLGVKYLLEGSVRRVGPKIRINAQLIDAESGGHMWADRYDGDIDDIFSLQDEITAKIVNAFEITLAASDRGDEKRVPTSDGEAYDLFLKARTHFYLFTPDGLKEAKALLESVIRLDPNFAEAYSLLSYCYFIDWNFHMAEEAVLKRALDVAQKAVELDPNSGYALARLGWVLCFFRRYEEAIETFERAVVLSPSNAEVFAYYGETLNFADQAEKGLEMTEQGIRLDPLGPPNWDFHRGHSYYKLSNYNEALAAMTQSINRGPTFPVPYLFLAVIYVEIDQPNRATEMIDTALKYNPKFRMDNVARVIPHKSVEQRDRFLDGLRKAGLPENI